jgi:hypothetical protein
VNTQITSLQFRSSDSRLSAHIPDSLESRRAITEAADKLSSAVSALATTRSQNAKAEDDFRRSYQDTEDDEHNDDPCYACHLDIRDLVGENFGEVEEDAAALVEHLNARLDFKIFAYTLVERVEGWFGVPEELWSV